MKEAKEEEEKEKNLNLSTSLPKSESIYKRNQGSSLEMQISAQTCRVGIWREAM